MRCSENRSRSDTTPATLPSRVTTTWRIWWRAIAQAASARLASSSSATTDGVMSSEMGPSTAACGAATRSSTSCVVKMPSGRPASSATTMDPTRSRRIRSSTSRTGVSALHVTAGRRTTLASCASIPAPSMTLSAASSRSLRCERARSMRKVIGAEGAKARALLHERLEVLRRELPAERVGLGAVAVGGGAPADQRARPGSTRRARTPRRRAPGPA